MTAQPGTSLHDDATVIDLHAHPSMKTFLGTAKLKRREPAAKGLHLTRLRNSHPSLESGGVDVICSCVVTPERELRDDCWLIEVGQFLFPQLRHALSGEPDAIAFEVLDHLEREVDEVNAGASGRRMAVVKSNQELDHALQQHYIAVIHTIEGAHVLNRRADNVARFKARGVAMMAIAHFYDNGIAPPVDGVPDYVLFKQLGCFRRFEDLSLGLPPLGKQVVEAMWDQGMIVDLTHTTPKARKDVFDVHAMQSRNRPIVMSHVGVTTLKDDPKNPTPEEIRKIADTGGVAGIIFYNYWLTDENYRGNRTDDLRYVVRTVREIANIGGDDCVAFGSDWDGITDPPDDLKEPADWPDLTAALQADGFSDEQITKYLGGNFRRVLREGWD